MSFFGPRTRVNIQLTNQDSGRRVVLPVEVFLSNDALQQWWASGKDALIQDLLKVVARNSHILSRDNIMTADSNNSAAAKRRRVEDAYLSLRGDLLEATSWEIRETQPKGTIITFVSSDSAKPKSVSSVVSGFCLETILPVTLLLWLAPRCDNDDGTDFQGSGTIPSFFAASSTTVQSTHVTVAPLPPKVALTGAKKKKGARAETPVENEVDDNGLEMTTNSKDAGGGMKKARRTDSKKRKK